MNNQRIFSFMIELENYNEEHDRFRQISNVYNFFLEMILQKDRGVFWS